MFIQMGGQTTSLKRRYYGISTAIVLWAHFLVILSLSVTAPEWFEESTPWYILYSGSATFILVGLMGLTSNNFAVRKMGARSWKTLHLVGGYLAPASFVSEYVLVLYAQPILLPDYVFVTANSPVLAYGLFAPSEEELASLDLGPVQQLIMLYRNLAKVAIGKLAGRARGGDSICYRSRSQN